MNDLTSRDKDPNCLVEIIELKWLLAAHGVHLHVEHLQADSEYARATLDRAAKVPSLAVREVAARLRACLATAAAAAAAA